MHVLLPALGFWEKLIHTHTQRDNGNGEPQTIPCPATPMLIPGTISPSKTHLYKSQENLSPTAQTLTHQEGTTGASLQSMFRALPRIIGNVMGCKGSTFCDCTGLTVGFCERWGKHERMDKGIQRAYHISAGVFSGYLSGPVLHLLSCLLKLCFPEEREPLYSLHVYTCACVQGFSYKHLESRFASQHAISSKYQGWLAGR